MEKDLKYARLIANVLDTRFELFGVRFGINTLFQLVPGIGDFIAAAISLYIISIGIRIKVPSAYLFQMIWNVGLSFIVGLIPFVGDTFYIFYRPNVRNVRLLEDYAQSKVQ